MTHILAAAARWVLTACATADRHTGGLFAVAALAAVIAAAAWWGVHAWTCRCAACTRQPEPLPPLPVRDVLLAEPDLHDDRCGTNTESLRACNAIWKLTPRREENR